MHTAFAPSGVTVIELPWTAPPLTENQRLHFRKKAAITTEVRKTARMLAERVGPIGLKRPRVTLVWLVTSRHKRDEENLIPTFKALCDGLVDAGVAADDTPELMGKGMPIIAYAKGHAKAPGMFLVIWDSPEPTAEERRALEAVERGR